MLISFNSCIGSLVSCFGLTYGVLGKTVLYLAVKVLFRVACEKI